MKIEMKILNKEFYSYTSVNGIGNKGKYDLPNYATTRSAGIDLVLTEDLTLYPGETKLVGTGLAIWIGSGIKKDRLETKYKSVHHGIAGLILPRSGLGHKLGLVLGNGTGLIDEDYQGELMVSCWNRNLPITKLEWVPGRRSSVDGSKNYFEDFKCLPNKDKIQLKAGDRFAQLVFIPVIRAEFQLVEEFSNKTNRGHGGFGSTGK